LKRRWNISIWAGFAIVLVSLVSYIPFFALFPVTRDIPWANYLLFLAGLVLLGIGLNRAFRNPDQYRGKIFGSILGVLALALVGFFYAGVSYFSKLLPASLDAPRAGQSAPTFTLAGSDGKQVSLADLLKGNRGVLLIFYRGYW